MSALILIALPLAAAAGMCLWIASEDWRAERRRRRKFGEWLEKQAAGKGGRKGELLPERKKGYTS